MVGSDQVDGIRLQRVLAQARLGELHDVGVGMVSGSRREARWDLEPDRRPSRAGGVGERT